MTRKPTGDVRPQDASRRALLKGAGVGAALLGTGAAAGAQAKPAAKSVDVVIVGAGFSGLAAARQLTRAGKSVMVLEAQGRVGGRTKAGQIAGHTIDLGGAWSAPSQHRLLALAEEYGVRPYLTPIEGRNISEVNGVLRQGERDMPSLDEAAVAEFMRLAGEIDAMSAKVSLEAPWSGPDARGWDSMTLRSWIDTVTANEQTRGLFEAVASAVFASDTSQFSLLYFLFYTKSADGLLAAMALGDGAQKWLYHGGVHQIAARIAAELGPRVVLNAPVEHVRQDEHGVEVTSAAGVWRARRAILAVPPALCARISFTPALPAQRDKLTQRFPMGTVIKFWVAYDRPFWREQGLNGYLVTDKSPMAVCIDATPDGSKEGLLVGFIDGAHAIEWGPKGPEARRAMVVGEIARLIGPQGARAIDYTDNDWPAEEWSRGCYGGVATPGTLALFGEALRQPVGRIHWAGTETSPEWMGYIDGAIRAGERAATEAAAAL